MKRIHGIGAALTAIMMMTGCGTADDEMQVAQQDAGARDSAGVEPLTEAELARLMEEYPRLRADTPLPEPQPNGRANGEVPERVRRNLSTQVLETITGEATFYADKFEGRRTASGIPFRQNQLVAAHRAYPFGTILRVTNTRNDRSVNVRVVDRGPFGGTAAKRSTVLDLSRRAATELGYIQTGRAPVRVEVLEWGQGVSG